jgi:prepilin peptidase CpaA
MADAPDARNSVDWRVSLSEAATSSSRAMSACGEREQAYTNRVTMGLSWQNLAVYAPLLALVGYAAVTDVRARRIPNWLTLTVILSGLAQSLSYWALISPKQSLLGLVVGFAVTFLLYSVGGRGAGDVKLTAGIGAWLGPWPVLWVFMIAAIVSLVSSLGRSLFEGKLFALFRSTGLMILMIGSARRVGIRNVLSGLHGWKSIGRPLPNGVSTLVATVMVIVWVFGGVGHAGGGLLR